ncbi:MAG: hypothetical protein C0483_23410 [Pirellula sp.]|nr:hypothetical protein [Pirellula sp.]
MNNEPTTQRATNPGSTAPGNVVRKSITSTLLANQHKKLQDEVESLIAGVTGADKAARGKTVAKTSSPTAAPSPNNSVPTSSKPQNSGKTPGSLEQTLLQTALEKRRIRPVIDPPPVAAPTKAKPADEKAAHKPKPAAAASRQPTLPREKRWWVQNGQKAALLNAEQMAAAYSQGLLRLPSVRVREEHGNDWHPITRFLHEFSWEAELGHPDAPPTAAQLQAWKRLGQR